MKIKQSATVGVSYHPAVLYAMEVVDRVWSNLMLGHPIVTGLGEEGHSKTSLHYGLHGDIRTRAFDVRTKDLGQVNIDAIDNELRQRLAAPLEFDIVWEASHLHIEYQPKEG